MKKFLAFVKKEFLHIFRDKRTLLLLFCMPVVLVILFGFAITTEIKDAHIAILDKSNDPATREIKDKILSSGYFKLEQALYAEDELEAAFRQGNIKLAVVFEENFNRHLEKYRQASIQVIADATEPNTANTLTNYMAAIIRDYQKRSDPAGNRALQITTETRMLYNPRLEGAYYFVPGVITIILLLVSALMTSVTIAREKEFGNMEILLVSPLNPGLIIIGKAIPYILVALTNALTVLYIGYAVFDMPLAGNLGLLLLECLLFVFTSLSLGILISTVTNTQQTAMLASMIGLMMPNVLLSGFIFPIESMPEVLQWISNIVPSKWFIIITKDIMLKGVGFDTIWQETLTLTGMTVLFMLASVAKFKTRLE